MFTSWVSGLEARQGQAAAGKRHREPRGELRAAELDALNMKHLNSTGRPAVSMILKCVCLGWFQALLQFIGWSVSEASCRWNSPS